MPPRVFRRSGGRGLSFASKELAISPGANSDSEKEGGRYDGPSQTSVATRFFDVVPFDDAAHGDSVLWAEAGHREHFRVANDGSGGGDLCAVAAVVAFDWRDGSASGGPRRSVTARYASFHCVSCFAVLGFFRDLDPAVADTGRPHQPQHLA